MNCPHCQYPNPQGATHCGLCSELFNRSAAETYLRAVQRADRAQRQPNARVNRSSLDALKKIFARSGGVQFFSALAETAKRYRKLLSVGALLLFLIGALCFMESPSVRLGLYGSKPKSIFAKTPVAYLVSLRTSFRSWSERDGQLDTPIENKVFEELGRVEIAGDTSQVHARAKEWIQQARDLDGTFQSQTIALSHPSLAPVTARLDATSHWQPEGSLTPRTGKTLLFVLPDFSNHAMRLGNHWHQPARWIDLVGDFKFLWVGELNGLLVDRVRRDGVLCDHMVYKAQLKPRILMAPAWCVDGARAMTYRGESHGEFFFDLKHHHVLSNTLTYEGLFSIPLTDLESVPDELRVGREVHGKGALILQVKNTIDIASPTTR